MKKIAQLVVCATACITFLHARAQTPAAQKQVKLFFEKVYLHTDRQVYTNGDDVWFKAYLLNAQDNHLIGTSKSLYIDLIAPDSKVINHEMLALTNGLGNGDIKLPDSLAAGTYTLRTYTNWMRNFGNNFIFEKKITIISPAQAALNKPATALNPVVQFFPEGGSLVAGISSIVAVKTESPSGDGLAARGAVLSSTGDTVARFTTDSLGMGMFALLTLPGQTYQAKATINGKSIAATLPAPLNNGLALKIYKQDTTLYAVITCNEQSVGLYAAQTLTLKARSFGRISFQQTLQLKGNTAAVPIPVWLMPGGIAAITLYDAEQKPHAERLIYVDGREKASITLSTNKPVYAPREKVTIGIGVNDAKGQPLKSNFSLSAVDATLSPADESNMLAYVMLQSELKGNIKNAARYFDTTNVQRTKQLDQLLLTQGWRDFVWKRLADTALRITYIPEQGISLSGTLTDKKKAPIPNANITLTANTSNGRLFAAQTDANGKYYFDNLQLLGKQSIRLNSKDAKGKALGTLSLDSLMVNQLPVNRNTLYNAPTIAQLPALTKASLIKQVNVAKQRSLSDTIIRLKDVEVRTAERQHFTDRMVTSFGYKDEVLTVTPEDGKLNSLRNYILNKSNQARTTDGNNLVFLADGKPVVPRIVVDNKDVAFSSNDAADVVDLMSIQYLELPITAIKKVVIKKLVGGPLLMVENKEGMAATAAALSASGKTPSTSKDLPIVFAIYLTMNPDGLNQLAEGATRANVNGYYEARTFYSPVYDKPKADNRTDARPTLYWHPMGSTDNTGKTNTVFYNSDSKTTVRILVQGISSNGVPFAGVKTYKVQ